MVNKQKRLEAFSEIFESEKKYLDDLKTWGIDFKRFLLNLSFINLRKRYDLVEIIFINIEQLINLHTDILNDIDNLINFYYEKYDNKRLKYSPMDIRSKYSIEIFEDFNISSVYLKRISSFFNEYKYYIYRLPYAEYVFENQLQNNPELKEAVMDYLNKNKLSSLGTKHFFYRPSQKLPRYFILFKAVLKNEENQILKEDIELLMEKIKEISSQVDNLYGKSDSELIIYRLYKEIKYSSHVKNRIPLGLYLTKRRVIKEIDIIVKIDIINEPQVYRVIILDNMLLICSIVKQKDKEIKYIYYEPLFLHKYIAIDKNIEYVTKNDSVKNLFPIFLLERSGSKIIIFYFYNNSQQKLFFNLITEVIENCRSSIDKSIVIEKDSIISTTPINYCRFSENFIEFAENQNNEKNEDNVNQSSNENQDIHSIVRHSNHYNDKNIESNNNHNITEDLTQQKNTIDSFKNNKILSPFLSGFFSASKDFKSLSFSRKKNFSHLAKYKDTLLLSNSIGFFYRNQHIYNKIFDKPVNKFVYDTHNNILIFLIENKLYISPFTIENDKIEERLIVEDIDNFYYGYTLGYHYIASLKISTDSSCTIILYKISIEDEIINFIYHRTLYVGSSVNYIYFFKGRLLVACNDFEIIDINTLKTQELIDSLDPCIPYYFHLSENIIAKRIFVIEKNLFLLCYNRIAFIIDNFGYTFSNHNIFIWQSDPIDFHLLKEFFVILSQSDIHIWNLFTGDLIYYDKIKNLKIVKGTQKLLFYDDKFLYKLISSYNSAFND